MHWAAVNGDLTIAILLLDNMADIEATDGSEKYLSSQPEWARILPR